MKEPLEKSLKYVRIIITIDCGFTATVGGNEMDIGRLSMLNAQIKLGNEVGLKVLDKALDDQKELGQNLVNMIDRSAENTVYPNLGSNFDVSV